MSDLNGLNRRSPHSLVPQPSTPSRLPADSTPRPAAYQPYLALFEKALAVVGILFFAGSLSFFGGNLFISLVRYGVFFSTSTLLALRWRRALHVVQGDLFLCSLLGLGLISFAWSAYPYLSLSQSREILYAGTFGLYLAVRFRLKEQLQLLALALGGIAIFSLCYGLLVPEMGIHQVEGHLEGAWRGIMGHKNSLGSLMTIAASVFCILSLEKRLYKVLAWAGLVLAGTLIILSSSKTALGLWGIALMMLTIYRMVRWRNLASVLCLLVAIATITCGIALFLSQWNTILLSLDRDPTLSGRTIIWEIAMMKIRQRPLLGYGRGAFWAPGSPHAIQAGLAVSGNYIPPHSHNGFIDLALDVGLIGATLLGISLLLNLVRGFKRTYLTNQPEDLWPLLYLTLFVLYNLTESLILYQNNLFWVLYITSAFSVRLSPAKFIPQTANLST
ncbi:MAG: O-antigen ligase [Synechococcales bacterium]|nr:O-antigen ligase [Synechococcales bacterium]